MYNVRTVSVVEWREGGGGGGDAGPGPFTCRYDVAVLTQACVGDDVIGRDWRTPDRRRMGL